MKHPVEEILYIVKIGGNVINDPQQLSAFLRDFAAVDHRKLLIHGGGKLATELAEKLQIPVQMIDGRRITDAEMLKIVTMVYGGLINKSIVAQLQTLGCNAIGMTGADANIIRAKKRSGWQHDYGFVGDIKTVDNWRLDVLIETGVVPVLAPLTHDGQGNLLNTNADTIAAEVAKALAEMYRVSLIYCFEKPGVLQNAEDDISVIAEIDAAKYQQLKANKVISAGMIPKLDNAFAALAAGVAEVRICRASDLPALAAGQAVGTLLRG